MKLEVNEYPEILLRVKALGFKVFEKVDYDMNIIGERNPNGKTNQFDDWIHLLFKQDGIWQWYAYPCTTDAGKHYLLKGNTAILVHNQQYSRAYMLGLHRGNYRALVQRGNEVKVWRDRNQDLYHDYDGKWESGYFGINIHRASEFRASQSVNKYSAGCQVFSDPNDYDEFLRLCALQIQYLKYEFFTYTLLLGK